MAAGSGLEQLSKDMDHFAWLATCDECQIVMDAIDSNTDTVTTQLEANADAFFEYCKFGCGKVDQICYVDPCEGRLQAEAKEKAERRALAEAAPRLMAMIDRILSYDHLAKKAA